MLFLKLNWVAANHRWCHRSWRTKVKFGSSLLFPSPAYRGLVGCKWTVFTGDVWNTDTDQQCVTAATMSRCRSSCDWRNAEPCCRCKCRACQRFWHHYCMSIKCVTVVKVQPASAWRVFFLRMPLLPRLCKVCMPQNKANNQIDGKFIMEIDPETAPTVLMISIDWLWWWIVVCLVWWEPAVISVQYLF